MSATKALAELVQDICRRYGFSKEMIVRHKDISGKLCPMFYAKDEGEWLKLRDRLYGDGANSNSPAVEKVIKTTVTLNNLSGDPIKTEAYEETVAGGLLRYYKAQDINDIFKGVVKLEWSATKGITEAKKL